MPLFAKTPPLASGTLPEADGHAVWWQTFGDARRPAILLLHGGPGGGTPPRMPRLFDPARWHVVTMDQRGAGRSRPHAGDDAAAHLVGDLEARTLANGASHAINQAAKVAEPALGGLLLTVLEPQAVFAVNAAVSALAAALLATLPHELRPPLGPRAEGAGTPWGRVGGALALVRTRPPLRLAIGLMSAGFFALFFYDALIPLLTRALGHSERVFGTAIAAVGAGGVLGAALLAAAGEGRPFARMGAGYLVSGAAVGGLGLAATLGAAISAPAFVALFAVLGLSSAATVVPYRTVLQNHAPPEAVGRVTALGEAASTTALLVAPFVGAAIAAAAGVGAAFAAGGAGLLGLALLAWIGSGQAP